MATSTFAAPLGVPIFRAYDANGNPLAAGQLETYVAGTSTPLATYPTYVDALAGTNPNATTVILDANGAAQVWVQAVAYKFILKASVASGGATLYTQDNVAVARGSPFPAPTEWVAETNPFVFASGTSFTVTGVDVTATYHAGRRIRTVNTGGTRYSTVSSSAFAANTTVNLVNDAGVLDAGLSSVAYGWNSYTNPSYLSPRTAFTAIKNGNQTAFAASTKIATWTVQQDANSEWDNANNRWVCRYPGFYLVQLQAEIADTVANVVLTPQISLSGGIVAQGANRASATANNIQTYPIHYLGNLTAAQYIEGFVLGTANTTVQGTIGTRLTVTRLA